MSNVRKIISSKLFLLAVQVIFSAALAVGAIFYVYSNVIVFRAWKVVLIDLDFILSCGVLLAVAFSQKQPELPLPWLAVPFLVGAGVFSALFFGVQAIAAAFWNETLTHLVGLVVLFSFYLSCIIAQNFFRTRKDRSYVLWLTSVLALGVYALSIVLSCAILPHGKAFKAFSKDTITFERASAEELALSDGDKAISRDWFETYLGGAFGENAAFAFDFSLGGKSFGKHLSDWDQTLNETQTVSGVTSLVREFTHRTEGVQARLEAFYYEETATAEWTVYLTNASQTASSVLKNVYALDASLALSSPTLYFSGGSAEANDDFALYSRELPAKKKKLMLQ